MTTRTPASLRDSALFESVRLRFNSNELLVKLARKIYDGYADDKAKGVLPLVEFRIEESTDIQTFGNDLEVFDVVFTVHTPGITTALCDKILAELKERFNDAWLVAPNWTTVGCVRLNSTGAIHREGTFMATLKYEVTVQYKSMSPATRYYYEVPEPPNQFVPA